MQIASGTLAPLKHPDHLARCREDPALAGTGIASANRDPDHFDNPETLDMSREPNRHLSFGKRAHYCLGAPLARMEGRIALTALFERLPVEFQ